MATAKGRVAAGAMVRVKGRAGAAPEEGGNCTLVWMSPWAVGVITPLQDTPGKSAPCSSSQQQQIAMLLQGSCDMICVKRVQG